jgi:hypothetical protein
MTETLSVADVLERAADLIEPEGAWTQGDYVGPNGRCWCVLGAIKRAGHFHNDINPAALALKDVVGKTWLHEWNDAPERTQAEVVAKLREAATLSRSREDAE